MKLEGNAEYPDLIKTHGMHILKYQTRAGRVAQVAENAFLASTCPRKHEALSSTPSTTKSNHTILQEGVNS
jgi:hypothetical protein